MVRSRRSYHGERKTGNDSHTCALDQKSSSRNSVCQQDLGANLVHSLNLFSFAIYCPSLIQCEISNETGRLFFKIFYGGISCMLWIVHDEETVCVKLFE
jgi:hypothetical protein